MTQFPPGSNNPPAIPPPPQAPFGGDFDLVTEPKNWPKVIGIISIVWGSLGVICNACNTAGQLGGPAIQQWAAKMNPQAAQQMQNTPQASMAEIVIGLLALGNSILLIIAGSVLVARQPRARLLHLIWASIGLVLTVVGLVVGFKSVQASIAQMQTQLQQQQSQGSAPPPGMASGMATGAYGMFACIGLITIAYPVFCLIWFGLVKRDTREITHGVTETVA